MSGLRGAVRRARHRRVLRRLAGPRLLKAFAEACPDAFFVEIGANDGQEHDHLHDLVIEHGWSGIMVEPVPYVFERLRKTYADVPGVTLENAAVSDRDGSLTLYHLAESDDDTLPPWYHALGTTSRDALLRHAKDIPDVEDRIVTTVVPCLTFPSLCAGHDVHAVDLVLLDTEGHDYEILRTSDLPAWRPRLVIYEHYHLSPEDRAACRALMEDWGYETMEEGFDTWCLRPHEGDDLTRRWRRLRPGVPGVSVHDE